MSSIFPIVAALLAQGATQKEPKPEVRTMVLPGGGYIRYEVQPGDDEKPAGELTVVHEEHPAPAPPRAAPPAPEPPAPVEEAPPPELRKRRMERRLRAEACAPLRAKLVARMLQLRGIDVDPAVADWLEHNLTLGGAGIPQLQINGEPMLLSVVRTDSIARWMAEDLARCERNARR